MPKYSNSIVEVDINVGMVGCTTMGLHIYIFIATAIIRKAEARLQHK